MPLVNITHAGIGLDRTHYDSVSLDPREKRVLALLTSIKGVKKM